MPSSRDQYYIREFNVEVIARRVFVIPVFREGDLPPRKVLALTDYSGNRRSNPGLYPSILPCSVTPETPGFRRQVHPPEKDGLGTRHIYRRLFRIFVRPGPKGKGEASQREVAQSTPVVSFEFSFATFSGFVAVLESMSCRSKVHHPLIRREVLPVTSSPGFRL